MANSRGAQTGRRGKERDDKRMKEGERERVDDSGRRLVHRNRG